MERSKMLVRPQNSVRIVTRLAGLLMVGAALCAGVASSGPDSAKGSQAGESLFRKDEVLQLEIEIPNRGINTLRRYAWSRDSKPEDRVPVAATVREGTTVYTNVALHLK